MYARVATFESNPAQVDDAIEVVRSEVESGETPEGLGSENVDAHRPPEWQGPRRDAVRE